MNASGHWCSAERKEQSNPVSGMTNPSDQIIDLYRRHAVAWHTRRAAGFMERPWIDRFRRRLPSSAAVLDIGCGSGDPISRHLIASGCKVTGIDASPELIATAKEHLKDGTWITADMRDLQLAQRFDGLIAWNSLFHLRPDAQRAMFACFARLAKPNAVLMFTSGPKAGEAVGNFEGEPLYHASLDPKEYRQLLAAQGFNVLDHVVQDPTCGDSTIWLAQRQS